MKFHQKKIVADWKSADHIVVDRCWISDLLGFLKVWEIWKLEKKLMLKKCLKWLLPKFCRVNWAISLLSMYWKSRGTKETSHRYPIL